ncbi:hypothetical protein PCASD_26821, partial [Puccinia coronata f. sp. avenae]
RAPSAWYSHITQNGYHVACLPPASGSQSGGFGPPAGLPERAWNLIDPVGPGKNNPK